MKFLSRAAFLSAVFVLAQGPAIAQVNAPSFAGAYLASKSAISNDDFRAAGAYLTRALALSPGNQGLMNALIFNQISLGKVDTAVPIAKLLKDLDPDNRTASLAVSAKVMADGQALDPAMQAEGDNVFELLLAWSQVGQGDMTTALASFDRVAEVPGFKNFALGQKALALALVGDYQGADDILSGRSEGTLAATRQSVIGHVQILSQLERAPDAIELLNTVFPDTSNPEINALMSMLSAGAPIPFDRVTSARDGQAEVFFELASFLDGDKDPNSTLLYARLAEYLRPDLIAANLLVARVLEDLGQYDLATASYKRVPKDNPAYFEAEIGRSDALMKSGKPDEAIIVLKDLAAIDASNPTIHSALGDLFRRESRFAEAITAYDKAISLLGPPSSFHWLLYYSRGISLERDNQWDKAEKDLRYALELRPNHPLVLNYLGYSYVEKRQNLDEALEMIETAVRERPDDGYITDSLGWVLYTLGRYQDAVTYMEIAIDLTPLDPIINDHLGDVYWAVGRQREARFQWRRAMSFDPAQKDLERIRRKLDVGLDVVLAEENAAPLSPTNGG